MLRELKGELEKALNIMKDTWQRQNNTDDNLTNFIYNCNSLDEIIKVSKSKNLDLNYVLHRWYNFKTSDACEKIFEFYGAIKEKNPTHHDIDFYIANEPFDLKLTVYPYALKNTGIYYDLTKTNEKNKLIEWFYLNQSQQNRKHMKNRIFIVCDGSNNMKLKSDFSKICKEVKLWIEPYLNKEKTPSFNTLIIKDIDDKEYTVKSDIILITN